MRLATLTSSMSKAFLVSASIKSPVVTCLAVPMFARGSPRSNAPVVRKVSLARNEPKPHDSNVNSGSASIDSERPIGRNKTLELVHYYNLYI